MMQYFRVDSLKLEAKTTEVQTKKKFSSTFAGLNFSIDEGGKETAKT